MNNTQACEATPQELLLRQLLDWNVPKSEREWCAVREIELLRDRLHECLTEVGADFIEGSIPHQRARQLLRRYDAARQYGAHWDPSVGFQIGRHMRLEDKR